MEDEIRNKIATIVDGKLSNEELEKLISFFGFALNDEMDLENEHFFRDMAFEMTGSVKELAILIIDFKKSLKARIQPEITELATKHIPHTADQLEGIIETTEKVANKIMDNLDLMQESSEKTAGVFAALRRGEVRIPGRKNGGAEVDHATVRTLSPLLDYMELSIQNHLNIISDTFVQMSFQDLTGQRIRRIMSLVNQMEERIRRMVVSFGIKIAAREQDPNISEEELQRAVAEKETELAGPQKSGQGLDQAGIDDLLANL